MSRRWRTLLAGLLAAASLTPAARAEPGPATDLATLVRTGSLELARRDFVKAAEAFDAALAIDADHTVALEGLGHSLAGLGIAAKTREDAGETEAAAALLRQSLTLNPGGTERLDSLHAQAEEALARLDPAGATAAAEATPEEPPPTAAPVPAPPVRSEADDDEIVPLPGAAAAAGAGAGAAAGAATSATPDAPAPGTPSLAGAPEPVAADEGTDGGTPGNVGESWELAEYPQEDFDALLDDGARALRRGDYPLALEHFKVARMVRPDDGEARAAYRETISAVSHRVQTLVGEGSRDDARDVLRGARQVVPDDETLRALGDRLFPEAAPEEQEDPAVDPEVPGT